MNKAGFAKEASAQLSFATVQNIVETASTLVENLTLLLQIPSLQYLPANDPLISPRERSQNQNLQTPQSLGPPPPVVILNERKEESLGTNPPQDPASALGGASRLAGDDSRR